MRALVVGVLVVAILAFATPANAVFAYCKHGRTWGLTGHSSYWHGWTDDKGRHRHEVRVATYFTQKTRTEKPVCPKH